MITVSFLTAGTNSLATTANDFSKPLSWYFSAGVPPVGSIGLTGTQKTGDFAVQAQASPNKTVKVLAGKYIMSVTPTGETTRLVAVELDADTNVTIADNVTGSTRYDKIYLYLPADTLANPPANGDFTEVAVIKTQRDATTGVALTDTNSVLLAEIVVANGFTTITDANITDARTYSTFDGARLKANSVSTSALDAMKKKGWDAVPSALTYVSGTTMSGTGFLSWAGVGDKLSVTQSIPLTSYWNFDGNSTDTKGSNNGTDTNMSYTATGTKFTQHAVFNGASSKIVIADAANLKPTGAFTIGMWVKTSTASRWIFQSWSDNTNANGISVYIGAAGKIVFGVGSNAADDTTTLIANTAITDGNWHYVVVSYQSNFARIFVDGVLDGSGYASTPSYAATNYVRIGCVCTNGSDASFFNGALDDLFLSNGFAVDAQWVAAKYAQGTAQTNANITATQYFNVVSPITDTLLTLAGGADYVLYNGTISSPYYSKGNAVGFPHWMNWVPVFYKPDLTTTIAGTPNISRFQIIGQTLTAVIRATAVGNPAGSSFAITSAVTPKVLAGTRYIASGFGYDGAAIFPTNAYIGATEQKIRFYKYNESAWGVGGANEVGMTFSHEI